MGYGELVDSTHRSNKPKCKCYQMLANTIEYYNTNVRQLCVLGGGGGLLWDDFPATTARLHQNPISARFGPRTTRRPPLSSVAH